MILSKNLKKNNIIVNLKSKKKSRVIEELLKLAVNNKEILSENYEVIDNLLLEREKSMSTGIGNGVAIPHCTTDLVDEMVIIFGISNSGIDFDSIDGHPAKIIILLIVPNNKLTQHIKNLANIAKMMNNDELRNKIMTLKTPESILKEMKIFYKEK